MNISKPLYETIPLSYVIGGVICLNLSASTMAILSSLLLACTGVLILIIRRNYRSARQADQIEAPALFSPPL